MSLKILFFINFFVILIKALDDYDDKCENAKIDAIIAFNSDLNSNPWIINDHYYWEYWIKMRDLSSVAYISDMWRDVKSPVEANPDYWIYHYSRQEMTLVSKGLVLSGISSKILKCLSIFKISNEKNGEVSIILSNFQKRSTIRHKLNVNVTQIRNTLIYSSHWDKYEVDLPNDTLFESDCTALAYISKDKYWKADAEYLIHRNGSRTKKYSIRNDVFNCDQNGLNKSTSFIYVFLTFVGLLIWSTNLILPYMTLYRENVVEIDDFNTRLSTLSHSSALK